MKYRIEALENGNCYGKSWADLGVQPTLGQAYNYSKDAENELPNFGEVIWDEEIPAILANCRELGIHEFTISSTFSSLIQTIATFEELGCNLDGIVRINSRYEIDWACINGEQAQVRKQIPAFKMSL